ncbi:uncharacterized protein LOC131624294 [Vicia villosa]|uniref:uncharacterized protein LOC131624294 n=1 Tax=Vicia villosa TaxID=3911 RepID=UPI00273B3537|nr:uncharacterized protein LOC131624294 [Vicia villosa]
MVKAVKFYYIMIIFLSLFTFSMNSKSILVCKVNEDCPQELCEPGMIVKCDLPEYPYYIILIIRLYEMCNYCRLSNKYVSTS